MQIWKHISITDKKYSVSNDGLIKRNKRERFDSKNRLRVVKEKIIKPCLVGKGYFSVTLRIENKSKKYYVHRLVAIEFLENNKNLNEVNHIDLNKLNNNSNNLEWVTKRENSHHWYKRDYFGVTFNKKTQKWSSRIMINGNREFLGYFENKIDAINEYKKRLSQV